MDFGIGGTERDMNNANEAFADIAMNKTLFIQKLTPEAPYQPDLVKDLETVDQVFGYFKPAKEVTFETEEGVPVNEELRFGNLGDFGSKGITKQSKYLNEVSSKQQQYLKIVKDLKSNKALQSVVQNADTKEAFVTALKAMIKDLEDSGV